MPEGGDWSWLLMGVLVAAVVLALAWAAAHALVVAVMAGVPAVFAGGAVVVMWWHRNDVAAVWRRQPAPMVVRVVPRELAAAPRAIEGRVVAPLGHERQQLQPVEQFRRPG